MLTNRDVKDEYFPDQMQNEAPTTVRKVNIDETVTRLEENLHKIVEKLQTKDSEIDLLNEEVKTAYSIISTLSQRVSDLEKCVNKTRKTTADANIPAPREERSLLLRDTNLQRAMPSDVESCLIRTIRGAHVDLLRSWISEKLTWTPSKCFIYAGLYDLNNLDPVSIIYQMTELVGELKEKNDSMQIFIS